MSTASEQVADRPDWQLACLVARGMLRSADYLRVDGAIADALRSGADPRFVNRLRAERYDIEAELLRDAD